MRLSCSKVVVQGTFLVRDDKNVGHGLANVNQFYKVKETKNNSIKLYLYLRSNISLNWLH